MTLSADRAIWSVVRCSRVWTLCPDDSRSRVVSLMVSDLRLREEGGPKDLRYVRTMSASHTDSYLGR